MPIQRGFRGAKPVGLVTRPLFEVLGPQTNTYPEGLDWTEVCSLNVARGGPSWIVVENR